MNFPKLIRAPHCFFARRNFCQIWCLLMIIAAGCTETEIVGEPPPQNYSRETASAFADTNAAIAEVFAQVNALRERQKVPPLTRDEQLAAIATTYAQELARRGELSHFDRAGNTLENRLNNAAFTEWHEAGENLARRTFAGYLPDDIVKSWNLSRPHYEAMIDRGYHRTGIGCAVDAKREMIYFVQLFAD